jgi:hypothetical protein
MTMRKITLDEATRDQVKTFAEFQYGIEVAPQHNKNTIVAKMRAAGFTDEHITLASLDPMPMTQATGTTVDRPADHPNRAGKPGAFARVIIAETEAPGGTEPVNVCVNGNRMQFDRGRPVWMPYSFYRALLDAKYIMHEPPRNDREPLGPEREVPRFAVTTLYCDPAPAADEAQAA